MLLKRSPLSAYSITTLRRVVKAFARESEKLTAREWAIDYQRLLEGWSRKAAWKLMMLVWWWEARILSSLRALLVSFSSSNRRRTFLSANSQLSKMACTLYTELNAPSPTMTHTHHPQVRLEFNNYWLPCWLADRQWLEVYRGTDDAEDSVVSQWMLGLSRW